MNKNLIAIMTAGALLAAPVHADDLPLPQPLAQPQPQPLAKPLPELLTRETRAALDQAFKELRTAQGDERNIAKLLEVQSRFEFSPELRPKLKEMFGVERPFQTKRVAGAKGRINYAGKLAPHLFVQGNGTDFNWTELSWMVSTDKAGRSSSVSMAWPSLVVAGQEGSVGVRDMSLSARQVRGADGVAYGPVNIGVGSITVREAALGGKDAKELVRLEGMRISSETRRRGAMAEVGYQSSVKAMVFGAERVERANFAFHLTNVPAQAIADLDQALRMQQEHPLAPDAQLEIMTRKLKEFGRTLIQAGATLTIDDISAAYRGNTASLKGRLTFQKVADAELSDVPALMKKLVAHFEVRVPVALVKDVGATIAAKSMPAGTPDAARQVEAGADGMVSMVVGKAVTGGYAVLEKNELRTTIDFKNGELTVNGKAIDLSKVNFSGKQ